MKIISLIQRTQPTRTNKEQNAAQRKLYFASRGPGRSARDGEMAAIFVDCREMLCNRTGWKTGGTRTGTPRAAREKPQKMVRNMSNIMTEILFYVGRLAAQRRRCKGLVSSERGRATACAMHLLNRSKFILQLAGAAPAEGRGRDIKDAARYACIGHAAFWVRLCGSAAPRARATMMFVLRS
jgi:hypothetical protein